MNARREMAIRLKTCEYSGCDEAKQSGRAAIWCLIHNHANWNHVLDELRLKKGSRINCRYSSCTNFVSVVTTHPFCDVHNHKNWNHEIDKPRINIAGICIYHSCDVILLRKAKLYCDTHHTNNWNYKVDRARVKVDDTRKCEYMSCDSSLIGMGGSAKYCEIHNTGNWNHELDRPKIKWDSSENKCEYRDCTNVKHGRTTYNSKYCETHRLENWNHKLDRSVIRWNSVINCENCGEVFTAKTYNQIRCVCCQKDISLERVVSNRGGIKYKITDALEIARRFGFDCHICGESIIDFRIRKSWNIDHLKPSSHYPELREDIENLRLTHSSCNISKGDAVAGMRLPRV